jgi:uncharacterized membrane protein YfcA
MSNLEVFALAASAALAGAMNAVAGGGTLVTFPALLFFGMRPEAANATSTLALMLGTAGSMFGFREHAAAIREWLARFCLVSVAGGFVGAWLLTHTDDAVFARLVPFLVLFATVLFAAQSAFRKFAPGGSASTPHTAASARWAMIFQFLVAVYGGYFGAGIGILMLASLGFLGLTHIHEMNALKTVLSALINVVATLWFIQAGLIAWPQAMIMTAGALGGYFAGAHYSQKIPQKQVRQLISGIGFTISGVMFYRQFLR